MELLYDEEIAILGDNIRYLRGLRGESLTDLAKVTRITYASLCALEQGYLDNVTSLDDLERLCVHFHPAQALSVRFRELS